MCLRVIANTCGHTRAGLAAAEPRCQTLDCRSLALQVGQLLIQGLNLRLQVGSGQGQLVQHPAQAVDVSLHILTQGQLVFISENQVQNSLGIHTPI